MSKPEASAGRSEAGKPAAQRVGVYLLQAAGSASAGLDLQRVAEAAAHLPGVCVVRTLRPSGALHPEQLAGELLRDELDAVVLAAEHPGFYQAAFARALALTGHDGEQVRLASFGEGRDGHSVERAKALIAAAVQGIPFTLAAGPPASSPASFCTATLVIGGGVAGIQASLEIAASGNKVYLVERTGTIGGRMAMFDKTFPTLDCAACILTPKMVAAGQNPNIEILALSEVEQVTGSAGAFKVKVLKRARRVDASACVACGDCARFCPVTVPSEFDMGIATRKGIFIPFPQAVPNTYMIDPEHCLWVQSEGKKCGACAKKCTTERNPSGCAGRGDRTGGGQYHRRYRL